MIIYRLIIMDDIWTEKEDMLNSFVSDSRQHKITRMRFPVDKKLSLYSELIARMGIQKFLSCDLEEIVFATTEHGKPYLVDNTYLKFNLSHTRNAIVCGLSTEDIGVDVEKIQKPPYEIMHRCFYDEEIKSVHQAEPLDQPKQFYRIWTQKEAYVKWNGLGITNNIKMVNTCDSKLMDWYKSWEEDEYSFSIYSKEGYDNLRMTSLTCDDVYNFFIGYEK